MSNEVQLTATVQTKSWTEKMSSPLGTFISLVALLIAIISSFVAWSNRQAVNEMRLTALEEKTKRYDAMIEQRNNERQEMMIRLTRIETQQATIIEMLKERKP
jgi:C4-dicarboxylate-specific signal transduction histidine kinase